MSLTSIKKVSKLCQAARNPRKKSSMKFPDSKRAAKVRRFCQTVSCANCYEKNLTVVKVTVRY